MSSREWRERRAAVDGPRLWPPLVNPSVAQGQPGALPHRRSLAAAWHIGRMPAVDTVLLPLCVGLTLLGVIATGIAWRRGNKGRVIQGIGLALAPIALYFSGLLRLLWNAVVAFGTWASKIIFSPAVWFGLSLARPLHRALGGRRTWSPVGPPLQEQGRECPVNSQRLAGQERARQGGAARSRRSMRTWPRSRRCSSPAVSSNSPSFVQHTLVSRVASQEAAVACPELRDRSRRRADRQQSGCP